MSSRKIYKDMMEQIVPSSALIQKTKSRMAARIPQSDKKTKEEHIVIKHTFRKVAVVITALLIVTVTAFAAWYLKNPGDVAQELGDSTLGVAFSSKAIININSSVASGDYVFTLLAVMNGKDITNSPLFSENVQDDRIYAAIAVQYVDGKPMSGDESFFASPLVKGLKPWQVNAATMNGGYMEKVIDGVLYRIVDCDDVSVFADRGLYFAICTDLFLNSDTFAYDDNTGEVSVNPDYKGASAVFELPMDKSMSDKEKAEQYLASFFHESAEDSGDGKKAQDDFETDGATVPESDVDWDKAEPVPSTVRELAVEENGFISYTFDFEYGGGTTGAIFEQIFTDDPITQSAVICVVESGESPDDSHQYAVRFTKDENGCIKGMVILPNKSTS